MSHAVKIEHLYYDYESVSVLKDISFSITKGDFFIIIGPNGSGKTTLIKTLSGILKAKKGSREIWGKPIQDYRARNLAKQLAFVSQLPPGEFPFTVMEMVLMGRSPHLGMLGIGNQKDIEIAEKAMNFTHVGHLADRRLNRLSGGELQRVFIARAICQETRIIVLDEPTAFLDLHHQIQIMDLLEKLKEEKGLTIIMVSHDLNLAALYGDRLLLMKDGQAVSTGTAHEVLTYSTLEKAYGCLLLVDKNPLGDFPRVTPVPRKLMNSKQP